MKTPDVILAVDWAKLPKGRSVYMANVDRAHICRLECECWTLESLLSTARAHRRRSQSVLVSMDLVFGTAVEFWRAALRVDRWAKAENFVDWLRLLAFEDRFWQTARHAGEWSVEQPFFAVPAGPGTLSAYRDRAGHSLLRSVDRRCRAKPAFCVSGIPGTVGSGTRDFWRALAPLLDKPRDFAIWPFEGFLNDLLGTPNIVLAEGYPALAYGTALEPDLPARMRRVGKTKPANRARALEELNDSRWIFQHKVELNGLVEALDCEDDFDALMSAAGVLRSVLQGYPLESPDDDPIAEGGILLAHSIDFSAKH